MAKGVRTGWGLVVVRGQSMLPTLGGWRRLALVQYGSEPRIGDVVVVDRPDRPGFRVIKRLTDQDDRGWWVESDNRTSDRTQADSWQFGHVQPVQILGVVRWPRLSRPRA